MKTFEQLNDQELVTLTDEEIKNYIKLKKAETGIKIISLPETPSYGEIPAPDMEVFEVAGLNFQDRTKAEEIANAINKHIANSYKLDYDYYRSDGSHYYAKPFDGSLETVNLKRCYSIVVYNSIKDTLASNKKIKEAWEKIKSAYDDEEEKSSEIVDKIYEAISKARERIQLFHDYKNRIVEYLQLSGGNTEVAWNFFDKAYAVEPAVKNLIMESNEYQEAVKSYVNA